MVQTNFNSILLFLPALQRSEVVHPRSCCCSNIAPKVHSFDSWSSSPCWSVAFPLMTSSNSTAGGSPLHGLTLMTAFNFSEDGDRNILVLRYNIQACLWFKKGIIQSRVSGCNAISKLSSHAYLFSYCDKLKLTSPQKRNAQSMSYQFGIPYSTNTMVSSFARTVIM